MFVYVHSVMFAQQNCLTTPFSEHTPVLKQCTVFSNKIGLLVSLESIKNRGYKNEDFFLETELSNWENLLKTSFYTK